ncbi:hypothetical protein GOP47_0004755 [Adiantum capillus-veneris]|uniref:UMP kinase n=1 Tax=Adiantum capillus-veneris TaxID=13818 RepID=A0A9D4V3V4_ADICA|nr:hypothetical protein GOP47_0004755 [Adiantum capillus-veneris]
MTSDEDFILYDESQSAAALASCGRAELGRSHSDEAESSQKLYSGGDARDEYSEEQDFRLTGAEEEDRLHQHHSMNGGRILRRPQQQDRGTNMQKRRDRDETSDGGTAYFKKGKIMDAGSSKKDREEWSDGAISCLLDAYTEKYLQLNRGNLRGSDWEEVAAMVSERSDGQKPAKTVDQCKNKVDSLKKRYKTEKNRGMLANNGVTLSYWPWFKKVDQIVGAAPKLTVLSDEEKEHASAGGLGIVAGSKLPAMPSPHPHHNSVPSPMQARRSQGPASVSLGFLNSQRKLSSSVRWKRVLLKVSGKSLMGDHTQNVDPEIIALIAREVATVSRLGIEVAIVVGGGNFFQGSAWVSSGTLDRASADHIGMMATVMNSIFLQASLENAGVQTRVQTAYKLAEIAEPYIRRRAIRHLEKGRVVIFAAGIGNPYFTTDTAAALRAAEINAEVVLKATNFDGIFDSDPKLNAEAILQEHISYRDAAAKGSAMIDITAITLCQENAIPVVVFNLNEPGNISKAVSGERIGTLIDQTGPAPLY